MDELVLSLEELARAPRPRDLVGGKAASLGRLIAAGVPVPGGLALSAQAHALDEDGRAAAIDALASRVRGWEQARAAERAGSEGARLAVRSSAAVEDRLAAAAPGVFASRLNVTLDELPAAVRAVWASAETPLWRAYARARGLDLGGLVRMAVVVQPMIAGEVAGVAYTRPPGRPEADEMIVETHERAGAPAGSIRVGRAPGARARGMHAELDAARIAAVARAALAAEAAIEAGRGADVEWVLAGDRVWIVQARPVVHPPAAPAPALPEALLAFSRAEPEVVWRWDVTHNPDPLSPAQAGLVERMSVAGLVPGRMRVVGGYLYYGRVGAPGPPSTGSPGVSSAEPPGVSSAEPPGASSAEPPGADSAGTLRHRFETGWRPALEAALAAAEAPGAGIEQVLAAYERFYAVYAGDMSARIGAARRALPGFLAHALAPDSDPEALAGALLEDGSEARLETLIARVARGEATFDALLAVAGPMAPAWDVAAPTFAERPALLRRAVHAAARPPRRTGVAEEARARVRARLAPELRDPFDRCLALARAARDLGELDDQLFARAQAAVRRALLRLARQWELADADDVFFVPLDQILPWSAGPEPPPAVAVRRLAQAGRAARERQRAWAMPLAFASGRAVDDAAGQRARQQPGVWRGRGTGGRVRGMAVRVADLGDLTAGSHALGAADAADAAILVVPTLTPAMAVLLPHAAAVVAQHGGLLDHGAAMARELGLPCVVACARVWAETSTGDPLLVDADAGLVVRLAELA